MHTIEDVMEAVERLEVTVYGDPSRDKRGLVEKFNQMEGYVMEIRNDLKKVTWSIIIGVLVALLNLVINAKSLTQVQSIKPPSQHQNQ